MFSLSLKTKDLSKSYSNGFIRKKTNEVFSKISFEIPAEGTIGLMGPSGSGKSTFGRIIAGLEMPTSGQVLYKGRDIRTLKTGDFREFRQKVQMMFQDPAGILNPKKTIEKSVTEVLDLLNIPKKRQKTEIADIFDQVGLSDEILNRYPYQISGGQSQRIAIGRILLLKPDYIILDEPTSALDSSVQAQMLHLLKDIQSEFKTGYLFISHDESVVRFMSEKIFVMENGALKKSVCQTL